jgi:hypothetical protein
VAAGPTSGPGSLQSPMLMPLEYLELKLSLRVRAVLGLRTMESLPDVLDESLGAILLPAVLMLLLVTLDRLASNSGRSKSNGSDRNLFLLVLKDSTLCTDSRYMESMRDGYAALLGGRPAPPPKDWPLDRRTSATYELGGLVAPPVPIAFASEKGLLLFDTTSGAGLAEL